MKLSVIIPAYNEEKTIAKILDKLLFIKLPGWRKEILVINDASTDKTRSILESYQRRKAVKILHHQMNYGKTAAIRTGIEKTTGDYIIIQDADSEYDPDDIYKLLSLAKKNKNAVIYGSRFSGPHQDSVFGHKFGNYLLTQLTNILYGSHLSDMETCYKLIPGKYFRSLKIETDRFGFEPEITAKLLRKSCPIIELPISYTKRTVTEGKKIRWWQDGWATVWVLLRYRFHRP